MADGATEGEIYELSARLSSYPRDLLRRFDGNSSGGGDEQPEASAGGELGEVELSLGLSLGGCFGVEPKEKRLVRSSSISTLSMFPLDHQPDFPAAPPLPRTCSLPTETEEERRKRKELQSLKRLEAKRKRSEKRNAFSRPRDRKEEILDEEPPAAVAAKVEPGGCPGFPGNLQVVSKVNGVVAHPELPRWAAVAAGWAGGRPASQGSIGSQGSSSSAVSDFESKPMQGLEASGLSNCTEVGSPPTIPPLPNHTNHKASAVPPAPVVRKLSNSTVEEDEPSKKHRTMSCGTNGVMEMERNMMEEMPCVSTRGDGPNGRKIEGFLYRYRKGEEVRIVCVCHGSFLTPAEFVKHAGGGDVAHPLRHIVVNPTPATFI